MSIQQLEKMVKSMEDEENLQRKIELYTSIQDKYAEVENINTSLIKQINDYSCKKKRGKVPSLEVIESHLENIESRVDKNMELSDFLKEYKTISDHIYRFKKHLQETGITIQKVSESKDQFKLEDF